MIQLTELDPEAPKPKKTRNRPSRAKHPSIRKMERVIYGKNTYITLCYASTRSRIVDKEWFTSEDVYNFQLKKWLSGTCSDMCAQLNKFGYLSRRPINKTNHNRNQVRFEYRITQLGVNALHHQAKKASFRKYRPHEDFTKDGDVD